MRIHGYPTTPQSATMGTKRSGAAHEPDADDVPASGSAKAAPSADAVKVTVSDQARALSAQSAAAHSARIEQLRDAVAKGTLSIDPQHIADKLVNGQ